MECTEYSRKVDTSGRLVVPSKLREILNIKVGDMHLFYTHEFEGDKYLCIKLRPKESEIEEAKRLLREAGITSID